MKEIKLVGRRGKGLSTQVSNEDYEYLSKLRWNYTSGRTPCVRTSLWKDGVIKNITMHMMILGKKSGYVIDHKDGSTLNNQRTNLRFATYSENARNRGKGKNNKSGFKGVYWNKGSKRLTGSWKQKPAWVATIRIDGKQKVLGYFKSKEEAVRARIEAEIKIYGEFSKPDTINN